MNIYFDSNDVSIVNAVKSKLTKYNDVEIIHWCELSECRKKYQSNGNQIFINTPFAMLQSPPYLNENFIHFIYIHDTIEHRNDVFKNLIKYLSTFQCDVNRNIVVVSNNPNVYYKSCIKTQYFALNNAPYCLNLVSEYISILLYGYIKFNGILNSRQIINLAKNKNELININDIVSDRTIVDLYQLGSCNISNLDDDI